VSRILLLFLLLLLSKLITVDEAADRLNVSPKFIRRRVQDGRLRAFRIGGSVVRVDPDDVDALVQPYNGGDA
jgi:excisionase family DNA binding protein